MISASLSATLPPAEITHKVATAAKVIEAPTIDGDIDSVWQTAPENTFSQYFMLSDEATTELSGTWQALWDKDNLYLLLKVRNNNPETKLSSFNGFVIYTSANYTRKDFTFNPAYEMLSDTALNYEVSIIHTKTTLYGDLTKEPGVDDGPVPNPTLYYWDEASQSYLPRRQSNRDGIEQPGELPDPTVSSDEQRLIDDPDYYPAVYLPKATRCIDLFSGLIDYWFTIACIQSTTDGYQCEISIPWFTLAYSPKGGAGSFLQWDENTGYFNGGTGPYADSIRDYLGFDITLFANSEVDGNITNMVGWSSEKIANNDHALKDTSLWGTLQLLPAPSILGTDCASEWAIFDDGFKWHDGIGFVYDAFYPYIYLFDSNNWIFIFEHAASESSGFYLYDFSRAMLGISGCSYYPNYLPMNSSTPVPLVNTF